MACGLVQVCEWAPFLGVGRSVGSLCRPQRCRAEPIGGTMLPTFWICILLAQLWFQVQVSEPWGALSAHHELIPGPAFLMEVIPFFLGLWFSDEIYHMHGCSFYFPDR